MDANGQGRTPCRFFQSAKGCYKGDNCTFAHDKTLTLADRTPASWRSGSSNQTSTATSLAKNHTPTDQLRQWKYMIGNNAHARKLGTRLSQFFQTALKLANGDAGNRQEVVTGLATEGGLRRIDEVASTAAAALPWDRAIQGPIFKQQILPLLQVLSHQEVLSSFLLEHDLGTIFNFLFGRDGERTISIFTLTVQELLHAVEESSDDTSSHENLQTCLTIFKKIVDLNGSAALLDDLHPIAAKFENILEVLKDKSDDFALSRIRNDLHRVQRRLGIGKSIPEATETPTESRAQPKFILHRDAPGWLSEQGPRHDNDFEDISHIKILPTASEINASRVEYLPTTDVFQHHLLGADGLLDRQFRLLREDTVGRIRDAIKVELDRRAGSTRNSHALNQGHGARTFIYRNAQLYDVTFSPTKGMELTYGFEQPQMVQEMGVQARKTWWESSRRMQKDTFVCLLDSTGTPIFCCVSESGIKDGHAKAKVEPKNAWKNVFENATTAYVTLSLIDTNEENINLILHGSASNGIRGLEDLIEFPSLLLASFRPTLLELQQRSGNADLPFSELLALLPSTKAESQVLDPPKFAQKAGFRFDLSCLTNNKPLHLSPREPFDISELQRLSTLDAGQAQALVDALTRKLALVVGPPGTGKSYTGVGLVKVLLANRKTADIGPILCVCYTNHALDQLLEHLVDHGVEQIIRVGSQSKSEVLQNLNLRAIAGEAEYTKPERSRLHKLQNGMKSHLRELNTLLHEFNNATSNESVRNYLAAENPSHEKELFRADEVDEDGFQTVRHESGLDSLQDWLSPLSLMQGANIGSAEGLQLGDSRSLDILHESLLHGMTPPERHILYCDWVSKIRTDIASKLQSVLPHYLEVQQQIHNARQELDLRCLLQANVIGVTTSGLARITDLLSRVKSKVLLCEEAGEVLESHVITALLPTIEHAILIGDHLQLRPQINNYDLAVENPRGRPFSFDRSLFERLVSQSGGYDGGSPLPFSVLQTQRRMHPSISRLIRSTIYPYLIDSNAVEHYPAVSGMRKRLFWFDHRNFEAEADRDQLLSTSHSNNFEVDIVTALVFHIVRQGTYKSNQIAVLTPYLGQLRKLRLSLSRIFAVAVDDRDVADLEAEGVGLEDIESKPITAISRKTLLKSIRVATVDNFQGEEAEVIIISLVRSNKEGKTGFLKTSNRINVLLSRAKHGMYIIGNAQTASGVPMWNSVIDMFRESGDIGQSLELCCPRHPETPIRVQSVDDFTRFSPEGGCDLKCTQRLQCGHACVNKCHSEPLHLAVKCLEPCQRSIPGCKIHPCPRECGQLCPKRCEVTIPGVMLPCGHVEDIHCYEAHDLATAKCKRRISRTVERCGHNIEIHCCDSVLPQNETKCTAICGTPLKCGHTCAYICKECRTTDTDGQKSENHAQCQQICGRSYTTCNHTCQTQCHGEKPCPLCTAECDVKCAHSTCKKKCSEACAPCAEENCASSCPHSRCEMPCGVPCNWIPCSKRCENFLECGHQCPSVCGERCPSIKYCQVCCRDDIRELDVDFILGETYGEVDLDRDPCIFPDCGHVITVSNLDGYFEMKSHYIISEDGSITGISNTSEPFSSNKLKQCPKCRGSLRSVCRYGRIVKRALLDESTKRLIIWAHAQYTSFVKRVTEAETVDRSQDMQGKLQVSLRIHESLESQFQAISKLPIFSKLFEKEIRLRQELSRFSNKVAAEEQPYQVVRNMVENLRKRRGIVAAEVPNEITVVHPHLFLRAQALLMRLDLMLFSKVISMKQKGLTSLGAAGSGQMVIDFTANRKECEDIVSNAKAAKLPEQQVQGHIMWIRFAALENSVSHLNDFLQGNSGEKPDNTILLFERVAELKDKGMGHLTSAKEVCQEFTMATEAYHDQIAAAERMLQENFYEPITKEEMHQVLRAMAQEFIGTGHWYTCINGHPFTVGECGRPMERTTCPQCGAAIGGTDHQAAEGVTPAFDLEGEMENLRL